MPSVNFFRSNVCSTYIVDGKEKHAKGENGPDENVAKDASDLVVLVRHHDGSVPVDGDKGPCERARDDGGVDEARVRVVAKVERDQVDKVDDQHQLGPVKVGADKEHDKGRVEEVVEDKVAADARGGVDNVRRLGEEMTNVAKLEDKEDDPGQC